MKWRSKKTPIVIYMTCDRHMDLGPGREFNEGMNRSVRMIMALPEHGIRPVCLACQVGVLAVPTESLPPPPELPQAGVSTMDLLE